MLFGLGAIMVLYQPHQPTTSLLTVGTTYYPLYNFARIIGGDSVAVTNITPAGAEPHDYEPTPQQLAQLQQTDIVIYNGATFEPWIDSFLASYHHLAVPASRSITLLPASSSETSSTSTTDPHFWLDPVLAQQIVTTIRDSFIQADPAHTAGYQQRASTYLDQLRALNTEFRSGLANCKLHTVITSHNALTYVSRRYFFNVQSIAGVSPDEEPSPARLAELSAIVKQQKISTILFETLVSPKLAQTLATETGAQAAVFDPIEGLTPAEQQSGQNYITIQQQNLQTLRKAMVCQ
jgi:zinc transport system substrate-binding protein